MNALALQDFDLEDELDLLDLNGEFLVDPDEASSVHGEGFPKDTEAPWTASFGGAEFLDLLAAVEYP